ncbi:MAG TPA: transposase, partial [Methylomirabilota bacterium]|nr:transposase [Methylomirabilota bacterium]
KLSREQKATLKAILAKPPSECGIPQKFWDISSLKQYLQAEFGAEYESNESYRLIFVLHNYSFHLPDTFDRKRDDAKVKKRVKEIKEEIAPLLTDENWLVFTSDECRIIWDNARFHHGKKLKAKLSTTLAPIHLINLPPYAPDHNPQEHVWKYGKDKLANNQRTSLEETIQAFESTIMSRIYPYHF